MEVIFNILPDAIRLLLKETAPHIIQHLEEIRIRVQRPLELIAEGKPYYPKKHNDYYIVTAQDGIHLLNKLSNYSLYAFEEELQKGYITISGGHRVGLAGKVIVENGKVKVIKEIGSYNIRIARDKKGIADKVIPYLYDKRWLNTLIIGAPQTGKTTLLRDIARTISKGNERFSIPPQKVGIVDERSEIAGCVKGIPQHDLGHRVDVLDACPKAEGIMMMIRSMSPDVIIVDEIGRKEDCDAIIEALNAGVQMIMTIHAHRLEDIYLRPMLKPILDANVFERFIELSRSSKPGFVNAIRDQNGKHLSSQKRMRSNEMVRSAVNHHHFNVGRT